MYEMSKNNYEISRVSPQFCSFCDEFGEVLGTRDGIALLSVLLTGNTNQNISAPTDLSGSVNSNKWNFYPYDGKSEPMNDEVNYNGKRRKRSTNKGIEGLMEIICLSYVSRKNDNRSFYKTFANSSKRPTGMNEKKTGNSF